jgi:uncharacterized protein
MTLEQFFKENPSAALAFSGGVDSSYLLYAAVKHGIDVTAYYINSQFQPSFELEDARRLCNEIGAKLKVFDVDVLSSPVVAANPPDRCYHCKRVIFETILRKARADGYTVVMDGSNASDDAGDRPGMKALSELLVRSPLRECGIIKEEVRRLSKAAGLFTWDKPAYACLATRIPAGRAIDKELLQRIESAENALFGLGFNDFRVRVYGEAARLQFPQNRMNEALTIRVDIIKAIKPYFPVVLLDMEGR